MHNEGKEDEEILLTPNVENRGKFTCTQCPFTEYYSCQGQLFFHCLTNHPEYRNSPEYADFVTTSKVGLHMAKTFKQDRFYVMLKIAGRALQNRACQLQCDLF